jgi:hypothetical protein
MLFHTPLNNYAWLISTKLLNLYLHVLLDDC